MEWFNNWFYENWTSILLVFIAYQLLRIGQTLNSIWFMMNHKFKREEGLDK